MKKILRSVTIQNRLFLSSVFLICLIIISMYFLSVNLVSGLMIQRQADYELGSFGQANSFINTLFTSTEGYIETLYEDEIFLRDITEPYAKDDALITARYLTRIRDTINTQMINKDYISKVIVLGSNDFTCVYQQSCVYYDTAWLIEGFSFDEFMETSEVSMYARHYNTPSYWSVEPGNSSDESLMREIGHNLFMIRQLQNDQGAVDGIVIIVFADNIIENIIPSSPYARSLYLLNDQGAVLWASEPVEDTLFRDIVPSTEQKVQIRTIAGQRCLMTVAPLRSCGLRVASAIPVSSFLTANQQIKGYTLILGVFCFILAFLSSWLFSHHTGRQLQQLTQQFQNRDHAVPDKVSTPAKHHLYHKVTLKTKMICHFAVSIMLPTLLFISFVTYFSYGLYENKIIELTNDSVKQLKWNLDFRIAEYKRISVQTIFSDSIQNALENRNREDDDDWVKLKISEDFLIRKIKNRDIISMGLYDTDGQMIYSNVSFDTLPVTSIHANFLTLLENSADDLIYLGARKNYLGLGPVMLFARNIYSIGSAFGRFRGYLVFSVDQNAILGLTNEAKQANSGIFFLKDTDGNVITDDYEYETLISDFEDLDRITGEAESYTAYAKDGGDYLIFCSDLDMASLKVIGIVPQREIASRVYPLLACYIAILTAYLLVIFASSALISRSITKPIKELRSLMDEIQHENFKVHMHYEGKDEIAALSDSFNHMVDRLNQLIYENYQSKIQQSELMFLEKEAQLNALQQQINPHFLYNALEAIKWMAYKIGAMDICDMATALGQFFRGAISTGTDFVTFRQETEHLKSYIAIQKVRYQDKLSVIWEVSDDVLQYTTIKLILQPIVENAIVHGIEPMSHGGIVTIRGYLSSDRVCWEISDNGVGMSPDALHALHQYLIVSDSPEKKSIGIQNVYRRLKLYYGEQGRLDITSKEGAGTTIAISIPRLSTFSASAAIPTKHG